MPWKIFKPLGGDPALGEDGAVTNSAGLVCEPRDRLPSATGNLKGTLEDVPEVVPCVLPWVRKYRLAYCGNSCLLTGFGLNGTRDVKTFHGGLWMGPSDLGSLAVPSSDEIGVSSNG